MKKRAVWILAALLLLASGCGRQREEGGTEEPEETAARAADHVPVQERYGMKDYYGILGVSRCV